MVVFVLRGNYTAEAWKKIREDPGVAPAEVKHVLAGLDGRIIHYFFSLDAFDFYSFVEAEELQSLVLLRHLLMAGGSFSSLEGELLQTPDELLPALLRARMRLKSAPP